MLGWRDGSGCPRKVEIETGSKVKVEDEEDVHP